MIEVTLLSVLFVFGIGIGSFLNVLVWRLNDPKAPKFWQGRSMCPKCRHTLAWFDNIPLLSFVLLGGKCRYCRKAISKQYPIVEMTTAVGTIFSFFIFHFSFNIDFFTILIIVWAFVVIFFSDWEFQLIPDEMLVVIVALVFFIYHFSFSILKLNLLVGLVSSLAFFLVVLVTKFRGMGLGDVKLAFVMGFLLGFPNAVVAFWWAFILGGIYAVTLLLLKRKKIRDTIALGPFLVIGTLIASLWSDKLIGFLEISAIR